MKPSQFLNIIAQANKMAGYEDGYRIYQAAADNEFCKEVNEEIDNDILIIKAQNVANKREN